MKYRAVIKKSGEWWIGWLIDLPGVNAQEKTKVKCPHKYFPALDGYEDCLKPSSQKI